MKLTPVLHICINGEREDVAEKIICGFKYCPYCGKSLITKVKQLSSLIDSPLVALKSNNKLKQVKGAWYRGYDIICKLSQPHGYKYSITECRIGAMMYEKGWINGRKAVNRKNKN